MKLNHLLQSYFSLGVIIGALPNNIVDGQAVDATPVMGNFNSIVSQVNTNAYSQSDTNTQIANAIAAIGATITTYTPTISGGGTAPTYTLQAGAYVTLGSLVFCWGEINWSANGTGSSQLQVTLPFAVNATFGGSASALPPFTTAVAGFGVASAIGYVGLPVLSNALMQMAAMKSAALMAQVTWSNITAPAFVSWSGVYYR